MKLKNIFNDDEFASRVILGITIPIFIFGFVVLIYGIYEAITLPNSNTKQHIEKLETSCKILETKLNLLETKFDLLEAKFEKGDTEAKQKK